MTGGTPDCWCWLPAPYDWGLLKRWCSPVRRLADPVVSWAGRRPASCCADYSRGSQSCVMPTTQLSGTCCCNGLPRRWRSAGRR
jgi:hypothetical protein